MDWPWTIPLGGKRGVGCVATVDECDIDFLRRWSWHVDGSGYVAACVWSHFKTNKMHRIVMMRAGHDIAGRLVDHRLGNKLDNRRSELRVATNAENLWNMRAVRGAVPFKGVCLYQTENGRRYRARLNVNGQIQHVASFHDARDAAIAYDLMALQHYGEFAALNLPDSIAEHDRVRAEVERQTLERETQGEWRNVRDCEKCGTPYSPTWSAQRFCGRKCGNSTPNPAAQRIKIDPEELRVLVWQKPTEHIARDLGVAGTAIGKFCRKHGIEKPPRGYWRKLQS